MIDNHQTLVGIFKFSRNYSGIIIEENSTNKYIVFYNNFKNALNGDKVLFKAVKLKGPQNPKFLQEVKIIKILERKNAKIIGTFLFDENSSPKIVFDDYSFFYDLLFQDPIDKKYQNHKCSLQAIRFVQDNRLLVKIDKDFGHFENEDINQRVIFYQYGVDVEFSKEVINESYDVVKLKDDFKNRTDLTSKTIVSVDSETAKDLDDTICVEKTDNGYILYVSIADVSHYVQEGKALDQEAMNRGNSIYYLNKVIPMLPFEISNDLCSLNESGLKLTLTCQIHLDQNGNTISSKVYRSFIKNHGRLTYTELNDLFYDHKVSAKIADNNLKDMLLLAFQLYKKVNKVKQNQGALSFELTESKFIFDPDSPNKLIAIEQRHNLDAEKLIEEFMVLANQEVARFLLKNKLPGIYRIHPSPNRLVAKDMFTRLQFLANLKINLKTEKYDASTFKKVLNALKDKENNICLYPLVLQAMAKARYSPQNVGHFGLGIHEYLHFTSPIRRYADLVVHRSLNYYLLHQNDKLKDNFFHLKNLEEIADHISETEVQATNIEYKIEDIKKAEFFSDQVGHKMFGLVLSITKFGIFVTLPNTIQGLIPLKSLPNHYKHDSIKNIVVNKHDHHKNLKIGQEILVEVIEVNKNRGQIIFNLSDM
ncbi:ribonuclease R family protein [Mycoplasma sp. SG1]|uniref:ribonuclease R family protein n=1 Tax=Mycoplasma sp. SG1 TaxID=2810348 RepID=UPI002024EA8E|nr:VacB/RNase II family 3'-5' exoribonuclease [Mycoplasma sp. SG1]URM53005.1 VacB/RNase II family 3'-5' exoribonuclease [Mycoplasma sp. SG1]